MATTFGLDVRPSAPADAALIRKAGVLDANTMWAGDGPKTTAAWIARRTEISPTHARLVPSCTGGGVRAKLRW